MVALIIRQLLRRPLRNGLTLAGIAVATAVLVSILAFGEGYERALRSELDRSGVQMMLVPLGCPYDGAARVLKNSALENSLPLSSLETVHADPAIAVAAPLLIAALPRQHDRRTDLWVGLDQSALTLKPWWRARLGTNWFAAPGEVILGADVAAVELRAPGDKLFSPETQRSFRVAGILERSGTSDDSAFFVSLATAQEMFNQTGRLTAIAIRLKDPALVRETSPRLQKIPGAQVATLTEMMGTFLNLVGAVRTLVLAVAAVAVAVSALSVFNTLLAGILERTTELAVMRAIGASRTQIFVLLECESLVLTMLGLVPGAGLAFVFGPQVERIVKSALPFAPLETLLFITTHAVLNCAALGLCVGALASVYPAWRASRLPPAVAIKSQ